MFKWKNLYRFSQQGWEACNALVKSVWHRRTQRGGGKSHRSVLKPLGRWLQRRMLWLCGMGSRLFDFHGGNLAEYLAVITGQQGSNNTTDNNGNDDNTLDRENIHD